MMKIFKLSYCIIILLLFVSCVQNEKIVNQVESRHIDKIFDNEQIDKIATVENSEKTKIEFIQFNENEVFISKEFVNISEFSDFNYQLFVNPFQKYITNKEYFEPMIINSDTKSLEDAIKNYSEKLKLVTNADLSLYLTNCKNNSDKEEYKFLWHSNYENILDISEDGKYILTGGTDKKDNIYTWAKLYNNYVYQTSFREIGYKFSNGHFFIYNNENLNILSYWTNNQIVIENAKEKQINVEAVNKNGTVLASSYFNNPDEGFGIKLFSGENLNEIYDFYGIYEFDEFTGIVEVRQIIGDSNSGIVIFTNGLGQVFKLEYPSGLAEKICDNAWLPSLSPNGKYLAYTSPEYVTSFQNINENGMHLIDAGIYIKELETGETAYIPFDSYKTPVTCNFSWFTE